LLRRRYGHEIDSTELERRFAAAGYGDILADTLQWSTDLLEHGDSSRLASPTDPRLERLQRVVENPQRLRWGVYRRMIARNSRRAFENPRVLLHVVRPRFWQAELEGIRRRLTLTKW
jgi:hypothetical protein